VVLKNIYYEMGFQGLVTLETQTLHHQGSKKLANNWLSLLCGVPFEYITIDKKMGKHNTKPTWFEGG